MWPIIDTYLGIFIITIGIFYFNTTILNEKILISIKNLIVLICCLSLMHLFAYYNFSGVFKTFVMCLFNTMICKYCFNITILKASLTTFIYMILLIIPDSIELIIATKIFGMSNEYYYTKFASSSICSFIVFIIFVLLINIFKNKLKKLVNIKISSKKNIIIYLILTFLCIAIFFYNSFSNIEINVDLVANIFIIIVFIMIFFKLIKQAVENSKITSEYDALLKCMTTYENDIENERIMRHEAKNELRTIRAMISEKQKSDEIIEYIDEIVNDKYEIKKEKYAKFGYLPPNGIKGLCYFKVQEAENKNIKVSINISKGIINSAIYNLNVKQQRDFGRIIGVFLDNAIEASLESKEKQLGIEAYIIEENYFKFIISNTYNNKINNKIGVERFSTKDKKRGHGLLLVNQLIEKNNIFEISKCTQDKIYIQTVTIKNN